MSTQGRRRRSTPSPEERVARRASRAEARAAQIAADPIGAARQVCLDQLAAGARTRVQLERVLARKGIPAEAAGQVLGRFTELALIDDEAYAAAFVDTRSRGQGRRALAHGLRTRGVASDVVEEALELVDTDTETASARALVRRRLPSLQAQPAEVAVRRLAGMLARKGFPPGVTWSVVRAEMARAGAAGEELLDDLGERDALGEAPTAE